MNSRIGVIDCLTRIWESEVIVFEPQTSRVMARIGNIAAVHGMLVVDQLSRVYASATGTNEVVAIREATLRITARTPSGVSPGDMPYAPDTENLYVSNETRGTKTITPQKLRIK